METKTAFQLREEARELLKRADEVDHKEMVAGKYPLHIEFVGNLRMDIAKMPDRRGLYKIDQPDTAYFVMWHNRLRELPDCRVRIRMVIESAID